MRACEGIRIVEASAGTGTTAMAGQLFAGLAGSVNLFDFAPAPASEHESYRRVLLHQGKRQRIDLDAIEAAVEDADVVIVDRSIAALPQVLRDGKLFEERWPDKILCAISLYGAGNARSDWIGNELIVEAASALMACNGHPEQPPVTSGLPYALHTGALFAFSAVMTALRERDKYGLGQSIDLSLVDCITAILGNFLPSYFLSGKVPKRIGNRHTIAAPWNLYPAKDGAVVICTGTGGTGWWAKVTAVIDRPELAEDPRFATEADRVRNVEVVDAVVSTWTREHTMQEIVDLMNARAIPAGEICTIEMVLDDHHYRDSREMVWEDPYSDRPAIGNPLKVGAWDTPITAAAPSRRRAPAASSGSGPLAGIRVIEFASRTSVPMAGRLMRDFGADIIKIEPVKGDALRGAGQQIGGSSYLFHINNAGKRSAMIDPTTSRGRDLILRLAAEADVFVENLAPGGVEKMGLGADAMMTLNPALVYCSVSGFGTRSAYGGKRALDTVVQAASGLMHMTGYPDYDPVKLGISAVDLTTASAVMASILAGLRQRDRTGTGLRVDLAMADVGVWMTQTAWPQLICDGEHPIRLGNRSPIAAPHDTFETADGTVAIAVLDDAQWRALAGLIGDTRLADPRLAIAKERLKNGDMLQATISDWTRMREASAVAEICQNAGIPASPVRDLAGLVGDSITITRNMVVEIDTPGAGTMRLLGNPIKLSRTAPVLAGPAPALGANTADVLREWLNMDTDEIAALAGEKVIPDTKNIAGV